MSIIQYNEKVIKHNKTKQKELIRKYEGIIKQNNIERIKLEKVIEQFKFEKELQNLGHDDDDASLVKITCKQLERI